MSVYKGLLVVYVKDWCPRIGNLLYREERVKWDG